MDLLIIDATHIGKNRLDLRKATLNGTPMFDQTEINSLIEKADAILEHPIIWGRPNNWTFKFYTLSGVQVELEEIEVGPETELVGEDEGDESHLRKLSVATMPPEMAIAKAKKLWQKMHPDIELELVAVITAYHD